MKKTVIKIKKDYSLPRISWRIKPYDRIHEKRTAKVNERVSIKKSLASSFEDFDEEFYNLVRNYKPC